MESRSNRSPRTRTRVHPDRRLELVDVIHETEVAQALFGPADVTELEEEAKWWATEPSGRGKRLHDYYRDLAERIRQSSDYREGA